jgi:nicotinamidase-related amidase
MKILENNTAAVIIDIQENLFPHIYNHEILLVNSLKLIEGLKILEIPIVITQQYTKGLGPTVQSVTGKFQEFSFIEKNSFSCCDEPLFMTQLARLEKKNILILGIEAHVCVLQTCVDLIEKGYTPVVIEDCIGSRKDQNKTIALLRMQQEGALITSSESILLELTRYSGSERFKRISGIIK